VRVLVQEEKAKILLLSAEEREAQGIDISDSSTYYCDWRHRIKRRFVIHVPEEECDILPPRSARAHIKQWMPYLPSEVVDKMIAPPNAPIAEVSNMKGSKYCLN
jgi:hypothetical protein